MTVEEIKPRRKHLAAVTVDGEEVLLDAETVAVEGIRVGLALSEQQLETLKYKSEFTRAKNKALWLVSRRDYSEKELISKLVPDFDRTACEEAVALLADSGVVDDERFARYYAEDLANVKRLSRRSIKYELVRKGIDRELAETVSEEVECDENEAIIELIRVKYSGFNDDERIRRRMYAALARKGYGYDDIRRAVNEYIERENN